MLSKVYVETCLEIITEKERGMKLFSWIHVFNTFYAPNFEKVGSILLSACACVRLSVQKKKQARVLKFYIWIPRQKIANCIFSCLNYLPLPSYAPFKG